jgi:transposase
MPPDHTRLDPKDRHIAFLEAMVEKLTLELAMLKRQLFGRSREAADQLMVQGQLFAAPEVIESAPEDGVVPALPRTPDPKPPATQRRPIRQVIPEHLPREETVLDLPAAEIADWIKIGDDVSERLAYKPGTYFVRRTIRPRYAKPGDPEAGVVQQPMPLSVIPSGLLDETLLAKFAIDKFADHQPLNRQVEQAARQGVTLALSTISENLLTVAGLWLNPLIDALWNVLQQRTSLHVDETVLPTLPDPKSKDRQTRKTRLWTYLNDQGPPIILYQYTDTKEGSHIRKTLANWGRSGVCYLHADAASNYDALYQQQPNIRAVNCFAHARRKFYEIAKSAPATRIFAHAAVEKIDALFADERAWKALDDQARYQQRQAIAVPKLAALKTMLADKMVGMSDSSATAKAIAYLLKRWDNFTRYTERGDLSISNNAAERALRKAALGRNNFLFVGNERGGEAAVIYYSLIETAKANEIEPYQWLLNALSELPKRKGSSYDDVKDLLPIKGAAAL